MLKGSRWAVAVLFAATCPPLALYHDGFVDQKWSVTAMVVLVLLTYFFLRTRTHVACRCSLSFASAAVSLYLCLFAIAQCYVQSRPLSGPFENPNVLALHLCLLLPFVHEVSVARGRTFRMFFLVSELLSVGVILLSQCRTAWLCLLLFYLLALLRGRWRLMVVPALMCVGMAAMFVFKQSSSHGRMFILHNTVEMIADAPLLGHGTDAFEREYMPRQADYFRLHDDSETAMLADDIRHPLNEFLLVGVNHGIVGIAVLTIILTLPLMWRKRLYTCNRPLWMGLCMLIVFCVFSYPLLYPLPCVLVIYCWLVTFKQNAVRWVGSFRPFLLTCTIVAFFATVGYTYVLLVWGCASKNAKRGRSAEMIPIYEKIQPYLSWRGIFLYDYAIESFYADKNEQAYRIAEECRKSYVSYDLALLEGDICQYLHRHDEALTYYDEASKMCPVRFAPLYGKWQVYKKIGDTERMDSLAKIVTRKEIKVYSAEIQMILNEIDKEKNDETES